ncbi:MAG: RNA polymerase sigma factor [Chloroflexi bacterium]|nr:RNA polymerase sigma factor [Chloroflexota bacterium]
MTYFDKKGNHWYLLFLKLVDFIRKDLRNIYLPEERSNNAWLTDLQSSGEVQGAALVDLRRYLLQAALAYLLGKRGDLKNMAPEEIRDLAEDFAQEALIVIQQKLNTFRGDSKFTTWAYRIVLNLAASELRRRRWRNVSLDSLTPAQEGPATPVTQTPQSDPEQDTQRAMVMSAMKKVIEEKLTERQRQALVGVKVEGLPVSEMAQRLKTNSNNVYKLLFDARQKVRAELEKEGWNMPAVLNLFEGG